ncbi:hypothetical protein HI808_19935 (plasmid) [Ralstonia solanacearum]|uniref:hypothetical protein n=1 Tax=Ralstonia pseudosolanacearum TaxID=1310165 RepID=UPI001313DE3C|nr:hypothetical protein [Ralstonia solanacearum]QKL63431.1 hypothetical protein HI812_19930 [Ralstonia solanacearum]QKL68236.1 hypothetical protein HI808_19935 [Ralstonia solanacearum]QKM44487.1 hypothetical protein HI792_19965 [Ralstonia solanacearum]
MMTALAERGRPALDGTVAGNSGSSAFHNSLVIFFRAMPVNARAELTHLTV